MALCMRYAKTREEAEDILQEGFIRVFRKIGTYKGTGSLEGLVRVKNNVHQYCRFFQKNLMDKFDGIENIDIIFIRNVLIYFDAPSVKEIAEKATSCLAKEGYIFTGHSETFSGLNLPLTVKGNSIYKKNNILQGNFHKKDKSSQIRVFIIDDSVTLRTLLKLILSEVSDFKVVGEAKDPIEAQELLETTRADVITLDIDMPRMTGIEYLESLKSGESPPIVMLSSLSGSQASRALKCLELGAFDYIQKPSSDNLKEESDKIIKSLKAAANTKFEKKSPINFNEFSGIKVEKDAIDSSLILIGSSTGGTEALKHIITRLPEEIPPMVIVQHIPAQFVENLALNLNKISKVRVKLAEDNEVLQKNTIYLAPGKKHTRLYLTKEGRIRVRLKDNVEQSLHTPSIDNLFTSSTILVERYSIVAALLTGMGKDGAKGLLDLHQKGCYTIAQNEESCVVFGMPKVAIELKAATYVTHLDEIADRIVRCLNKPSHRKVA